MYRLLEPNEPIQPGDEFWMHFAEAWSNDWEPTDIGQPASIMPAPVRRRMVTDWQTGPVPDPTGPSMLKLDCGDYEYPTYLSRDNEGQLEWHSDSFFSIEVITAQPYYTGRWCIQQIILPATDGIGS